ncbi:MAG TPA: primosomal protein N' [Opitutaceae bacterium]|jgi:primosomal protein N' (replication factor Y)
MIVAVHPMAGFDKILHYKVPEALRPRVALGSLVRVPVGRALRLGVVGGVGQPSDFPAERMKLVSDVIHPFPALTADLLSLAKWMAGYYAAPMDAVIEAMIPAAVRRGGRAREKKFVELAARIPPGELEALARRAPAQARLYSFMEGQIRPQPKALILERSGASAASLGALAARGVVRETAERIERTSYTDDLARGELVAARPHALNAEQAEAVAAISRSLAGGGFGVTLLHGVTGSGKTEVYLRAIQEVLESGGGVILLVPEVALTPQTVARLRSRLEAIAPGHRCVVWHSHLGEGERLDGWLALASGEARVAVGARSAVFAPVRNLRLVVVDEEHEPAYKQDEIPRYHGRDVAVMRASLCGAHCILGSATPSLESHANAVSGRYGLVRLTQRVDDRSMPSFTLVDMRAEAARQRNAAVLSGTMADALLSRFERREQSILFINRRGYSSAMQCRRCGHVEECPHCSVSMTYHRTDETVRCHLCGEQRGAPARCPKCGAPDIRWRGLGTQRVEEAVRRIMPKAKVERIDSDTMVRKNRFREILGEFRKGKVDVLVGTQMIGKGLDFPNVTLVGLVDADLSMHIPDFRANERTFQLLVQVAGRAGRGDRAGEVVVQSFAPHAEAIQFARHADFEGFAASELEVRRRFGYPPKRHLIRHILRGPNPDKLKFFADRFARQVAEKLGSRVEVKGPAPAPIEKIRDEYRWQVWYFVGSVSRVIGELSGLRDAFQWPDGMTQMLDVDPMNLV